MGKIIENDGTKELFFDFSYIQNVMFKDNLNQLDLIIEKLGIEGINSYQEFQNFLRNSRIKQAFICLVDDKTRNIGKKDNNSIYDAIIRLELNSTSQFKLPKETYLGFFVNINPRTPYLTITSIFETRLKPIVQEFESTIKESGIQIIKYQGQIQPDEILRRNVLNSSNIGDIGKLVSTFEEEKNKWLSYLDFSTELLNIQRKNSLPYLGCEIVEAIKVDKKVLDKSLLEKSYENFKTKTYVYFPINLEAQLKSKNIDYDLVNVVGLDILVDDIQKLERIKKISELALVPFRMNKALPPIYSLQKDIEEIFNFEFEKVQDTSSIVNLNLMLGVQNNSTSLLNYWQEKREIIFGGQKDFESIQKDFSKELNEWSIVRLNYEIEQTIELDLFKVKNNIDYLSSGYLAFVGIGEDVLIDRSRQVLKRIAEGNTKNPYLVNYLFNTKLVQLSETTNENQISDEDFNFSLNLEQKEAVKKALNSKDMFILQGPPGTGKTQVICEIIYQLAKLNRKVLISSQNHEAIKNVVDRLPFEPNINRIRLTNQLNTKSRSANNFSPERTTYNYYKSIAKSMFDDMAVGEQTINEFKIIESKLEGLINSSKGFHQSNTQMRDVQTQIDDLNNKISELKNNEINTIQIKNDLKDELLYIDNLIEVLNTFDFNVSINISKRIKAAYETEIKFDFDQFILNNIDQNIDEDNIFEKLKKACQLIILNDEIFIDIQKSKKQALEFRRQAEFELADSEEQKAIGFEKILYRNPVVVNLIEILNRFKKVLENLKVDIDYELNKLKTNENDELQISALEIQKNELQVTRQKLAAMAGDSNKELRELIKFVNNKFKMNLGITDVDLEQQVKIELDKYKSKLEISKQKNTEFKSFYENVSSYLKTSYGITNNWEQEIATKDFSNQMIQETKKYTNSIINNLVNVYAMTLTSTNLFRFNKDEYAKKMGLEEINLRSMDVDVVIIDEASKATLLEILMPLVYGKTLILVGDYRQLPPILKLQPSDVELVNEMTGQDYNFQELYELLDKSAFKNLISAKNKSITTMLKTQYRSHRQIMDVVNKFYDNELRVEPQVSDQKEHGIIVKSNDGNEIINAKSSVYWIDSTFNLNGDIHFEQSEEYSTSLFNDLEINLTIETLRKLDQSIGEQEFKVKPSVAVISFYGLHVAKLQREIKKIKLHNMDLIVNTVDDFQGKEADYVIVNLVRNPERLSSTGGREFLKKYERINVAFSRARELLVIIGAQRAVQDITVQIPTVNDPSISNTYEVYADIIAKINFDGGLLTVKDIL
ncbi:AAA domain-containing protein [Spiroplasma culicicola]|uniref:Superfamily I DNA/RNA helicase n=1 Tax=Spiroplasma culicicola AES-1 TaxID=1276246 RepID=W6A6L9_9MOLU|nr:AAA domain-containing protein [Spiroplasma culicicola]AHI52520.1 superfamily I DNA/RNA helicase [Spiroplasma culicicola AES-1]